MKKATIIMTMALATLCVGCGSGSRARVELGEYKDIKVQALTVEPTEEEIQSEIDAFLTANKFKDAENTVVDDGETVNIDYVGYLDGEAFEGGSAEGQDLQIGSNTILFEEQLIGKNAGETVTIDLTFPDTYFNTDLAGKETQFDVTVNYIYSIPELTEELVVGLGEYESVQALRDSIYESIKESKQATSDTQFINSVMVEIIGNCEFAGITDKDTEKYFTEEYDYYKSVAETYYQTDLETFLSWYGITEEEFKEECEATAMLKVKEDLVLDAIAEAEGIKISNAEYDTQIQEWIAEYSAYYSIDEATLVEMYGGEAECKKSVLRIKVREQLVKEAEVSEYVDELESSVKDMLESTEDKKENEIEED